MNDDRRKRLTSYLGECWHVIVAEQPYELDTAAVGSLFKCSCKQAFHSGLINKHIAIANRTFDTPADLHAVYSKMVEREEWDEFYWFAQYTWRRIPRDRYMMTDFSFWLSCYGCPNQIPERMAMAAEWIEGRRKV